MPFEELYGEGLFGEDSTTTIEQFVRARLAVVASRKGQDFMIVTGQGQGQMTFEKADNIMNNIFLSIMIEKGSFFFNPEFGLKKRPGLKNIDRYAALLVEDCKAALQWIIDIGRAVKFDISTERDMQLDLNRLRLLIEATQVNGQIITFETFLEVV